eukprot:11716988-Ditylum_brightwellii.AAC.1
MTSTAGTYEAAVLAIMPSKTLNREVYQNCAAVPSSLNGNNGHLGLVMPVADNGMRNNGNQYVASPNHPGNHDTTIRANAGKVMQS